MASHTPGPWRAIARHDMPDHGIELPDAWYIDFFFGDEKAHDYGLSIASLSGHELEPAVTEANAHLIAAAPDLLAALRAALVMIDECRSDSEGRYPSPDAGCIECTVGTVPNRLNTGLCAYHHAQQLVGQADQREQR